MRETIVRPELKPSPRARLEYMTRWPQWWKTMKRANRPCSPFVCDRLR
jgi:hypothetical protein